MLLLALVFVVLKLAATVLQILLLQGNYRQLPTTVFFRIVYVIGKATPALATASVCVSATLHRDWLLSWLFGLITIGVASLAVYVIRLRQGGRFFGLLDADSKRTTNN